MPWQLHATDRLLGEYGEGPLLRYAERLEGILRQNALPVPDFPAMIWSRERLPGGGEVAVGIAQDRGQTLAYDWPADKVQFVGTEEVTLESQDEGGRSVVVLRRYSPPND